LLAYDAYCKTVGRLQTRRRSA